ncbi:MAG TPA: lysophospholipid acyltransferase family protein [Longimicrobiales bacterium]|nr:lysophospholipid acyltransferase family protein [Longimicrobiales bacterium]
MSFYRFAQRLARTLWPLVGGLQVDGLENIPEEGPFLLLANHQSYLDPILIQAVIPRVVYAMAKSTQFSDPWTGGLLKRLKSFPARRFEVDPQSVRIALRKLQEGEGVAIYVEGERSWDGRLQEPRRGTLRVILKAGVPVIPCGISGAYDVWPRWDSRLRRGNVRIRFGQPMAFPQLDDRAERDALLPETRDRIMSTIADLADSQWGAVNPAERMERQEGRAIKRQEGQA